MGLQDILPRPHRPDSFHLTTHDPAAPPPPSAPGTALRRAALLGALASLTTVAASVIRGKATALALGPEGVGAAATIQQVALLLATPAALVGGPALLAALGEARRRGASGQPVLDTAWTALAALAVVAIPVGAIATGVTVPVPAAAALGGLAVAALIADAAARVPLSALLAREQPARYAGLSATLAAGTALAIAAATATAGLPGQFVAALAAPVVIGAMAVPVWRRVLPDLGLPTGPGLERSFLRDALKVGAATLIAGLATQGALSTIRWALWQHGAAAANGQFQAAWQIGSAYLGVVLGGFGTGLFPRYAAAKRADLPAEVAAASSLVFSIAPPLVLGAVALREPMIAVMYTGDFGVAADVLAWQLAGDVPKALAWSYAGVLLYRGHAGAFLVTEAVGAGLLALGSVLLVPALGPAGTGVAYLVAYALYAPFCAVVLARVEGVPVAWRDLVAALAFAGAVAAAAHVDGVAVRVVLLGIAAAWALRGGLLDRVLARVRARAR